MLSYHGSDTFMPEIKNSLYGILDRIVSHPKFLFTPTGSRYFGGSKTYSDSGNSLVTRYDFFVLYSEEVCKFCRMELKMDIAPQLSRGDRIIIGNHSYDYLDDPSVVTVYRATTVPVVDIQIIRPDWYDIKTRANDLIFNNEHLRQAIRTGDKIAKRALWWGIMQTLKNPDGMSYHDPVPSRDGAYHNSVCGSRRPYESDIRWDEPSGLGIGMQ